MKIRIIFLTLLSTILIHPQKFEILSSDQNSIVIHYEFADIILRDTIIEGKNFSYIHSETIPFRNPGEPSLPLNLLSLGIPKESNPSITILNREFEIVENKFIIPFPKDDPEVDNSYIDNFDREIYSKNVFFPETNAEFINDFVFRFIRVKVVGISPVLFNPVSKQLQITKKITFRVDYNSEAISAAPIIYDPMTIEYVNTNLFNSSQAISWLDYFTQINESPLSNYWYNPSLNYYKVYFNKKGVYRITFEELVANGVPISGGIEIGKLALYGQGNIVPIDIVDGGDGIFNEGDYFQFVGYPAPSSPFSKKNIYNNTNVYWFTFESPVDTGKYRVVDGDPRPPNYFASSIDSYLEKISYEEDKIFDRYGLAPNGDRDYWSWAKVTARNFQPEFSFETFFEPFYNQRMDSPYVYLNVNLHGVNNNMFCSTHRAKIFITDQFVGEVLWDGQKEKNYSTRFYVGSDSIRIFPTGNRFQVKVYGDACPNLDNDEIRVNWFEFLYWKTLKIDSNYFNFISPPNRFGITRLWTFGWNYDHAKIYIPSKSKMIINPEFYPDFNSLRFLDTLNSQTEYFILTNDFYMNVDSIVADYSHSDLRNISNSADYLIISHTKFLSIANQLKSFREVNY